MQKLVIGTAVIALTAVLSAGAAGAATVRGATAKPSAQDVAWMQSNAQGDLAEIAIGKLAMAKSHDADLLKVARVTMQNHATVLARLKVLARNEDVKLPAAPSASQQKDAKELESLSGAKFNLAWDNIQIAGHKQSIAQTETQISKGSAPAVISFAKYYLPIAKMHLSMVQTLHHQLT
jgi:putative membrane protein